MKYYIATATVNLVQAQSLRRLIAAKYPHWTYTYDWTVHGKVDSTRWAELAPLELDGVLESDVFIFILPGKKGAYTELGAALSDPNRKVVAIGTHTEFWGDDGIDYPSIFLHHPQVTRVETVDIRDVMPVLELIENAQYGSDPVEI